MSHVNLRVDNAKYIATRYSSRMNEGLEEENIVRENCKICVISIRLLRFNKLKD